MKALKMDSDIFSSLSKEEKYFISYIKDLAESSGSNTSFLNEREQSLALSVLKQRRLTEYSFFGGYPDAERRILFLGETDESRQRECIIPIQIEVFKDSSPLRHGDILGSILGLGIKRNVVGDILIVSETSAVVFILSEMADYIKNELRRIGRAACKVTELGYENLPDTEKKREDIVFVIASDRIDCLVGGLLKKSRGIAVEFLTDGRVYLNQQQIASPSKKIFVGDKISVRGFGKYEINEITQTQKGRLRVCASKFL